MQHAITRLTRDATSQRERRAFRRDRLGWTLTVLNGLMAVNSTAFFLTTLQTGLLGWLMMNSCAPSIALFAAGFLAGSPLVMVAASVLMARYGIGGLFVFGWSGPNLIVQASHILMTLAVLYTLVSVIRRRDGLALGWGILLGLALLAPYMWAQDWYFQAHPGLLERLFSGRLY